MASHSHDEPKPKPKHDDDKVRPPASDAAPIAAEPKAVSQAHHDDHPAASLNAYGTDETPEQRLARANDSIGSQVILDPASDAALASRGGATGTIEGNTAVHNAAMPRIVGLSRDAVGGTVTGPQDAPKLHRPVPWVEPAAPAKTPAEDRAEAVAQIVSP
jgi:hypothetical protein